MKIAAIVSRILLGLIFVFFGLNGFFQFLHPKELPTGLALQFVVALMQSHYVLVVSATQVLGGALLLTNRYVPLGVTLLAPVIVNILCYHIFLAPQGIALALIVAVLWFVLFFRYQQYFSGIFVRKAV